MDQRNLILAIVLSLAIMLSFEFFLAGPQREATLQQAEQQAQTAESVPPGQEAPASIPMPDLGESLEGTLQETAPTAASRESVLAAGGRVRIESPTLTGSVSLAGGRIDDLVLRHYRDTVEEDSDNIVLLRPVGTAEPYFANFGWTGVLDGVTVPTSETIWQADRPALTPDSPVTFSWDNGEGLRFERTIALDKGYMFTITQRVVNRGTAAVALSPYGLVSRTGTPDVLGFYILHEGLIGVLEGALQEVDYSDLVEDGPQQTNTTGGWLGITDKYWLVALVPDQAQAVSTRFLHELRDGKDKYQSDYLYQAGVSIPAGASAEVTSHLFAGAKKAELLDRYRDDLGAPLFDRAIDFGWFWFLTKPFLDALTLFNQYLGNFGLAILLLTVLVKLAFFPLANKSYRAMAKMRKLQPEMLKLRERFAEDKQRLNQEMMSLYKKEGANPMSGCLPIVIQIPVFFALYKVLFVSIEMRQAPFYGWIQDLSVRDPTTILNAFGLIPWQVPDLGPLNVVNLGVWPILMGITMVLQHRLNPQPADPVQAKIFLFMPIIFTFLLATFPAGLVIYWTWNNILSVLQQYVIMRRAGVPIGRQPSST
jgi:YidC/Oxa1 family membrane protein insertase